VILSGGIVSGGSILAGGLGILESGGQVTSDGSGSSLLIASGGTFEFASGTNGGSNIVPLSGATLELDSGAAFAVNNINAGIIVKVLSGASLTLSSGTISAGALVETLSGGSAIMSGGLADSGTLLASGTGSLVEILSDGVVSGGAVVVGNGIVDVLSGGSANVSFQSTGSGGLEIADTSANSSTFTGRVSGFGGFNHTNHKQFIDLAAVTSGGKTFANNPHH
jgi:subtilase-type serine protease